MSQPDFYAILDECVARLRQGESLEACLIDYPEQAAELNPALAVSANLLDLPRLEPAPEIAAQGFEVMMAAVVTQEQESLLAGLMAPVANLLSPLKPQNAGGLTFALRAAMLFLIVFVISSAFVISASADSLPGDTLYPVKRSWENTRLALTVTDPSRQALESKFAEERREEVKAVLAIGRPVIVEFQGRLESTGDEVWLIGGLDLAISDETVIGGVILVGETVYVRAQVSTDDTLMALEIKGDEDEMPDPIEPTKIPEPTRTPEPTREPGPTDEPQPTQEPTRRPTHEPTVTRKPTREPEPTATRKPEPTAAPTGDIKPTEEPRPTDAPPDKPTATPKPKDEPTRDKEPTPKPTEVHEPTATQKPSPEPEPTVPKEPTATHEPEPTREPESTATSEPTPELEPTREPEPTLEPTPTPISTKQVDAGDGSDPP